MIPYGRQSISEVDIQAVVDVLRSDYLTQGLVVPQFEQAVADYVGASYGVAVNSGTSALHIACLALGLGEGDWLWTSPITFVASSNCGLYCDAKVDFVDIDAQTFNMSVTALECKLQEAEKRGVLPKIVVPVHFAGQSCDMQAIGRLAKRYGFYVIEDACHAIGGQYQEEFIGSGRYSDITVFSFHPVKIITTAEGGMAMTNQPLLAEKMQLLRSHGITRDVDKMTHHPDGAWYYQQIDLGFNYRMTELQAALGLSQLSRIAGFIKRRQQVARQYQKLLVNLPVDYQRSAESDGSAWHLFVIRLHLEQMKLSHQQVFNALRKSNIGVNLHYIPVHLQPYYQQLGFKRGDFPEAENYYQEAISLPLFFELSDADIRSVVECLKTILS
ncbi:MAG: UDP-4-amino-4,6-dideoxy-N-acetyl-beta-L-altrosamine transaminase [Methylococcaceae bacterium]|nr:UDP-4-amino-4,6-dideoxy-N-acetyl-beta-L-altrosamine transaminase [Methylococcaceae bacterium]